MEGLTQIVPLLFEFTPRNSNLKFLPLFGVINNPSPGLLIEVFTSVLSALIFKERLFTVLPLA